MTMKETQIIMDMPITVEIVDKKAEKETFSAVFSYLNRVDARFSVFKKDSEISRINRGEISKDEYSIEMQEVFDIAEKTKRETDGYFDIVRPDGSIDPSGIVKGWAILNSAKIVISMGYKNFFVDAGGDIQTSGKNAEGEEWSVGIRNPFKREENIKIIYPHGLGVATSGTYIRGQHIYDPHKPGEKLNEIVSLTVIGPDVLEADRFATAAFAMGRKGINFIEQLPNFEGYSVDLAGIATMTSGFEKYTKKI